MVTHAQLHESHTRSGCGSRGCVMCNDTHQQMKSFFTKAKPFLITAAISIAAVYIWNTFLSRKVDASGKYDA